MKFAADTTPLIDKLIHERMNKLDASGIRRVFDLAAQMKDPINLSIGQPDFDVPDRVKEAAISAIREGHNKYTQTQGIADLRDKIASSVAGDFPNWQAALESGDNQALVTSGVSGALMLLMLTCVGPGDEVIFADPYFVMYKHLVNLVGGTPVAVDTYPDFELTAERVSKRITEKTKLVLFNSPGNPTGTVPSWQTCRELAELCDEKNVLLVSDEIYDVFCYDKSVVPAGMTKWSDHEKAICPSPARFSENVLLLRGFSKTYAMTGWRLGYAAGPAGLIQQLAKLQQYSFVCAPSMAQFAGLSALDTVMNEDVDRYQQKRDYLINRLKGHYEIGQSGGAFYLFIKVPESLGISSTQFVEKAIERNLLLIPGCVFSEQDTYFRLSYAANDEALAKGADILVELAKA